MICKRREWLKQKLINYDKERVIQAPLSKFIYIRIDHFLHYKSLKLHFLVIKYLSYCTITTEQIESLQNFTALIKDFKILTLNGGGHRSKLNPLYSHILLQAEVWTRTELAATVQNSPLWSRHHCQCRMDHRLVGAGF